VAAPLPGLPKGLPGVLAEVARVTSIETAVKIARSPLAGTRHYLGRDPGPGHPLVAAVGALQARVIAAALGDGEVEWPSAKPLLHWYDARRLRAEGASHVVIARTLRLAERTVRRLVVGMPRIAAVTDGGRGCAQAPGMRPQDGVAPCPYCGHRHRTTRRRNRRDDRQLNLDLTTPSR
jgi:hypothetical protein